MALWWKVRRTFLAGRSLWGVLIYWTCTGNAFSLLIQACQTALSGAVFETNIWFSEYLSDGVQYRSPDLCGWKAAQLLFSSCFHHQRSLIRSWVYSALKTHSVPWKHLHIHILNGLYVFEAKKGRPVSWRLLCIHALNDLYVFEAKKGHPVSWRHLCIHTIMVYVCLRQWRAIQCHGDTFASTQ